VREVEEGIKEAIPCVDDNGSMTVPRQRQARECLLSSEQLYTRRSVRFTGENSVDLRTLGPSAGNAWVLFPPSMGRALSQRGGAQEARTPPPRPRSPFSRSKMPNRWHSSITGMGDKRTAVMRRRIGTMVCHNERLALAGRSRAHQVPVSGCA
jgi:hypothetical protein